MHKKVLTGIALTMLITLAGIGVSQARTPAANTKSNKVDPVQTKNQRHKTPHMDRKAAAKRLRVNHQQEIQTELQTQVSQHQGYTGRGQAGSTTIRAPRAGKTGGAR